MSERIQDIIRDFSERRPILHEYDTVERLLRLIYGETDEAVEAWKKKDLEELRFEIADIVIYAGMLATVLGFDLEDTVREKMELNERRFPQEYFQEGDFQIMYQWCKANEAILLGRERPAPLNPGLSELPQ